MVFNCFGMLIAEIVSAPQGIPVVTLLIFALSLYPVGLMLGGSSCGCCGDETIGCDPCYKAHISNSTGIGRFSREQECRTCAEFNGNRIVRKCGIIGVQRLYPYLGYAQMLLSLLEEGPVYGGPPWYGYIGGTSWDACWYTSKLRWDEYDAYTLLGSGGCVFSIGKTLWKNATITMGVVGEKTWNEEGHMYDFSPKAIVGLIEYDNFAWRFYGGAGMYFSLWRWCVLKIYSVWSGGVSTDIYTEFGKEHQRSYFHGPVTPDENGNISVTMNFVAGPQHYDNTNYLKDHQKDNDCSGSITITNIPNPIMSPYSNPINCPSCIIPYPGYEFIKYDWNVAEYFGLTQTSITHSNTRVITNPDLCDGASEKGSIEDQADPYWCPYGEEGDCKCAQWKGTFIGMDDIGKDDPWKDHFNYVPAYCDGFNNTIAFDFAPYSRQAERLCFIPSCLVKEDGAFVTREEYYGWALCEDLGYDSIEYDPYMCILDNTPICPKAVCGGDSFCDCVDGCPDGAAVAREMCYNYYVTGFRIHACSIFDNSYSLEDDHWANPFGFEIFYVNPCHDFHNDGEGSIPGDGGNTWKEGRVRYGVGSYFWGSRYEPETCEYDYTTTPPRVFVDGCPEDPEIAPTKTTREGGCTDVYRNNYYTHLLCNGFPVTREITYS